MLSHFLLTMALQADSGLDHIPQEIDLNVVTEFTVSLPESSTTVCAVLHSLVDGSTTECKVTELDQGQYSVSLLPQTRGRHELTITSDGAEMEGSPFKVFVRYAPQMMGRPVYVIEGVSRPAGVALRGNTELIITEMEPPAVCIRDRQGKMIRSFEQGQGCVQWDNPYGVAIDSEGCVYVADLINCKIHKFSKEGSILKSVGGDCSGTDDSGQVAFPAGIKISRDDRVYICDDTNQKVHIFDKNLDLLSSFGEIGDQPGQFQSPSDIAFDSDGHVFVADTKREKIMKFSPEGGFLSEFEMKSHNSSDLELGICVSASGQMYVSDFWNHRIVVFNVAGEFVATFGKKGSEPGEFDMPAGIAVDEDGYVYVCDQRNCRVQVF